MTCLHHTAKHALCCLRRNVKHALCYLGRDVKLALHLTAFSMAWGATGCSRDYNTCQDDTLLHAVVQRLRSTCLEVFLYRRSPQPGLIHNNHVADRPVFTCPSLSVHMPFTQCSHSLHSVFTCPSLSVHMKCSHALRSVFT